MANVLRAGQVSALSPRMLELFGSDGEPMEALAARARAMFPGATPIVWECQVPSLQFCYVSDAAKVMLGYPEERWLEPGFWAETIVHRDDRDDAVTYCALATAKGRDHMFEYRARAADGRLVWLRDFVKVVFGADGQPPTLRGVIFDVTAEKLEQPVPVGARVPTREELIA